MNELPYFDNKGVFGTLTYNDEHLPQTVGSKVVGNLLKTDLQKYWKRVRKDLHGRKIKYFSCGEYGENNKRCHFHFICLGLDVGNPADVELLRSNWSFGFSSFGSVTPASVRYCTDYVLKSYDGEKAKVEYDGANPPFSTQSQGFGYRYVIDNFDNLSKDYDLQSPVGSGRAPIPRYYKDKIKEIIGLGSNEELIWSRGYQLHWINKSKEQKHLNNLVLSYTGRSSADGFSVEQEKAQNNETQLLAREEMKKLQKGEKLL